MGIGYEDEEEISPSPKDSLSVRGGRKKTIYDGFPFNKNSFRRVPRDGRSTKEVVKTGDTGRIRRPVQIASPATFPLCFEDICQDKYYSKYGRDPRQVNRSLLFLSLSSWLCNFVQFLTLPEFIDLRQYFFTVHFNSIENTRIIGEKRYIYPYKSQVKNCKRQNVRKHLLAKVQQQISLFEGKSLSRRKYLTSQ